MSGKPQGQITLFVEIAIYSEHVLHYLRQRCTHLSVRDVFRHTIFPSRQSQRLEDTHTVGDRTSHGRESTFWRNEAFQNRIEALHPLNG